MTTTKEAITMSKINPFQKMSPTVPSGRKRGGSESPLFQTEINFSAVKLMDELDL